MKKKKKKRRGNKQQNETSENGTANIQNGEVYALPYWKYLTKAVHIFLKSLKDNDS